MSRLPTPMSDESKRRVALLEKRLREGNQRKCYQATCVSCGHMRWRHWTDREVELLPLLRMSCGRCGSCIVEVEPINLRDLSVTGDFPVTGEQGRCLQCDALFLKQRPGHKYCSGACSNIDRSKKWREAAEKRAEKRRAEAAAAD